MLRELNYMANNNPYAIYLKVDLNFNCVFVVSPRSYIGGDNFLFIDVDFVGMDLVSVLSSFNVSQEKLLRNFTSA